MSVEEEYLKWQERNPNFITPNLIDYDVIDDYVVELSKGTGIKNEPIYGVSILERTSENEFSTRPGFLSDVAKPLWDIKTAKKYFREVSDAVYTCKEFKDEEFVKCLRDEVLGER